MAKASVELASVMVSIIPSLRGMSKNIRTEVAAATKGIGREISKELNSQTRSIAGPLGRAISKSGQDGARGASDALGKGLKRAGQEGSENLGANMRKSITNSIAGLGAGLVNATRAFGRGLSGAVAGASRIISSIGGSMQNYVVNPAMAGTAAMVGLGAAAVKTGVEYNTLQQTTRTALKTLLGDTAAANKQLDALNAFAKNSPFSKATFIEGQQQLLAFGFAAEEVVPALDAIQNAVAAMGGGNQQIKEIIGIFARARASQSFGLADFNQLADRGVNAPALLADALGMTEQAFREATKGAPLSGKQAINAINTTLAQMAKKNAGTAAGIKETWVGATDRIKAAWRDTGSILASPIVDPTGGGLGIDWANSFADSLRQVERIFKEFVTENRGSISNFLQPITDGLNGLTEALQRFKGSDITRFLGLMKDWEHLVIPIGVFMTTVFGGAMLSSIPIIGAFIPAIGPLVGIFLAIAAVSPDLRAAIGDLASGIGQFLPEIVQQLSVAVYLLQPLLTELVHMVGPSIIGLFSRTDIGWGLIGYLADLAEAVKPLIPSLLNLAGVIGNILLGVLQALGPELLELLPSIVELIDQVGVAFSEIWIALAPVLPDMIAFMGSVFTLLIDILISVLPLLTSVLSYLIEHWDVLVQIAVVLGAVWLAFTVVSGATAIFGAIQGAIMGVVGALGLATTAAGTTAAASGAAAASVGGTVAAVSAGMVALIAGAAAAIGAIIGFALKKISEPAWAEAGMGLADRIGKWTRNAAPWYNWGGGKTSGSIPRFAKGGVVPATRGGQLLIAGEAGRSEAIVDEGLLNKQLASTANLISKVSGNVAGTTVIEKLEVHAAQEESNEELIKRLRRILTSPTLGAGY